MNTGIQPFPYNSDNKDLGNVQAFLNNLPAFTKEYLALVKSHTENSRLKEHDLDGAFDECFKHIESQVKKIDFNEKAWKDIGFTGKQLEIKANLLNDFWELITIADSDSIFFMFRSIWQFNNAFSSVIDSLSKIKEEYEALKELYDLLFLLMDWFR